MLTFTEKLRQKLGHRILCDFCNEKKVLTEKWMMTTNKKLCCADCINKVEKKGILLISI